MVKNLCFLVIISLASTLLGQKINLYPDQLQLLETQAAFFNPSSISDDSVAFNLHFANKVNTRSFGKVALRLVEGGLQSTKNNKVQVIRFQLANEKEGPYISKNRVYFNYTLKLALSPVTYLSAGTSLGLASAHVDAYSSSLYANYAVPDASLGFTLQHKKFTYGFSSSQLFNNSVNAYSDLVRLTRYFNTHLSYRAAINSHLTICYTSWSRLFIDIPTQWSNSIDFYFAKLISLGGAYHLNRGLSFFLSASSRLKHQQVKVFFAYNSGALTRSSSVYQSLELSISFFCR